MILRTLRSVCTKQLRPGLTLEMVQVEVSPTTGEPLSTFVSIFSLRRGKQIRLQSVM